MDNDATGGAKVYKVEKTTRGAGEKVKTKAGEAGSQAMAQAANQKERAADTLDDISQAMHSAGEKLSQDSQPVADLVEIAAERVDDASGYLHNRDLAGIQRDAEQIARNRPALFLGGAFLTGLALARFLKGSTTTASGGQTPNSGQENVPADYDTSGLSGLPAGGYTGVQNGT